MGSAIVPARPENYNEDKFRFEFKTFGERYQALKLLERAGVIKGLELDGEVETGDEAGPGAVHVPAGKGEREGCAMDAGEY
jgi:hypothetical protein